MDRCGNELPSLIQPFPETGPLREQLNVSLSSLRKSKSNRDAPVYLYVIASVKNVDGKFLQLGSAPNFQGEAITLCTCKHHMRTFKEPKEWVGTWIAGFTGLKAGNGKNALVYLMRVDEGFNSHHDLWNALPKKVRKAKEASKKGNALGDVYKPKRDLSDRQKFAPENYHPPCPEHDHVRSWSKDIHYETRWGASPALLVGDTELSFLWDRPKIFLPGNIGIGQSKVALGDFLNDLQSEGGQ